MSKRARTPARPSGKSLNRPWRTPGGIRIRPLRNRSGAYSFRAEIPERITGKRILKQFKTADEAEAYAAVMQRQRENHGLAAFALSSDQRNAAKSAFDLLCEQGFTAPRHLDDAVRFYLRHHRPEGGDVTLDKLVDDYLREKRNGKAAKSGKELRPRSIADLETRLNIFTRAFGSKLVKDLTRSDIEEWLDDPTRAAQTRRNYHTVLNGLFRYAVKKKLAGSNPLSDIGKPAVEDREPGILTVRQAEALLNAALAHPELELGWYLTLGLFCGIRTEELSRLAVADVRRDAGFVSIGGKIAKKRRIRNVPFPVDTQQEATLQIPDGSSRMELRSVRLDPASAWLSRFAPPAGGRILPGGYRKRWTKLLLAAGFLERRPERKAVEVITPWPHNALRHSFGSYLYELTNNGALVAARMGHKSDDLLFEHYRALVPKGDGQRYFSITPPAALGNKVIPMPASTPAGAGTPASANSTASA